MKKILTKEDETFCNTFGTIGIALSTVCLVQCFVVFYAGWISFAISCIFIYAIVSFVFLILKRSYAPICVLTGGVLILLYQLLLLCLLFANYETVISLMLILLLLYTVVVSVIMFVNGLPAKLKHHQLAKKSEDDYWVGRI